MKSKEKMKMRKKKEFVGMMKYLWAVGLATGMFWGIGSIIRV